MPNKYLIQDAFLSQLKKDQSLVSIFLISGIKLHGTIEDYNEEVILLKSSVTQMVFQHAISTVVPARPV